MKKFNIKICWLKIYYRYVVVEIDAYCLLTDLCINYFCWFQLKLSTGAAIVRYVKILLQKFLKREAELVNSWDCFFFLLLIPITCWTHRKVIKGVMAVEWKIHYVFRTSFSSIPITMLNFDWLKDFCKFIQHAFIILKYTQTILLSTAQLVTWKLVAEKERFYRTRAPNST